MQKTLYMHFGKEVIFMMSFIMIAVTLVLAIAGVAFMFRKHSNNDNSDNSDRDTKVAIIFIILAIVTAVVAVILSMFSSGAPLP